MWLIFELAQFGFKLLVAVAESVFWIIRGGSTFFHFAADTLHARASLTDGELRCPREHVIAMDSEMCECASCGFTYEGSIWVCANPECGLIAPYVDCPTCGLSVRNPYRLGRP